MSSFTNLKVKYCTWANLFLCDLISRQFNRVYLENGKQKLSEPWSQILPVVDKNHVGSQLTPSQFTDLMLSRPSREFVDCFSKRNFYDQALHRYFTTKYDEAVEGQPRDLLFLASVYSGFNSEKSQLNNLIRLKNN